MVDFPVRYVKLPEGKIIFAWKIGNMDGLEMGVFEEVCHTSKIWNM